jgi:Coenzyme PQQ synthesis protein D (PqqD)
MVKIAPSVQSIVDDDGAVILDIPNDTITTLNATGAYIWRKLLSGLQIDAIVFELAHETGTDPATIAKDVITFMNELKSGHLVTPIDNDHSERRL